MLEAGRERVGDGAVLYCNTYVMILLTSERLNPFMLSIPRCPCLKCTIKIIQTGVREVVYSLNYKV